MWKNFLAVLALLTAVGPVVQAQNQSQRQAVTITINGGTTGHSVALTWTASPSSGVTGYNVYRSPDGSTYQKLASVGKVLAYTDSTVPSGKAVWYVVTATDGTNESAFSPAWTATVPAAKKAGKKKKKS